MIPLTLPRHRPIFSLATTSVCRRVLGGGAFLCARHRGTSVFVIPTRPACRCSWPRVSHPYLSVSKRTPSPPVSGARPCVPSFGDELHSAAQRRGACDMGGGSTQGPPQSSKLVAFWGGAGLVAARAGGQAVVSGCSLERADLTQARMVRLRPALISARS